MDGHTPLYRFRELAAGAECAVQHTSVIDFRKLGHEEQATDLKRCFQAFHKELIQLDKHFYCLVQILEIILEFLFANSDRRRIVSDL